MRTAFLVASAAVVALASVATATPANAAGLVPGVATTDARLRTRPVDGSVITTLPRGQRVSVMCRRYARDGWNWYLVVSPSLGWARSDLVSAGYQSTSGAGNSIPRAC